MSDILDFSIALCRHDPDPAWLRAEMTRRLADIREEFSFRRKRLIPAGLEELSNAKIDDIVTCCWLLTVGVEIDNQVLLELDALGAALDLVGCVERFNSHVHEALQARRQRDPVEDAGIPTRH